MVVAGPGLRQLLMVGRNSNDIDPARLNCDTKNSHRSFDSLRYAPVAQDGRSLVWQSFCAGPIKIYFISIIEGQSIEAVQN
jgi:hypothetical protein